MLGVLPKGHQLVHRAGVQRLSPCLAELFHLPEAPDEFLCGGVQRVLRVQMCIRDRLKTVKNTVTAYVDKTVASQNGKSYTYTVQPYSGQWDGPAKGLKVVRLTGVTLKKAAKSGSHIKLTWTRNSQAKGYEVYRKMGSGKWTKVKTIEMCIRDRSWDEPC